MILSAQELEALPNIAPNSPVLTKRIDPGTGFDLASIGVEILPKTDRVLSHLAMSDEREYDRMADTDSDVSGAIVQRISGMLAEGSRVVEASSMPGALLLKDFAVAALRYVDQFPSVLEDMVKAILWGWRPCEREWDAGLSFRGRPYFGVRRVVPRSPWHYYITHQGLVVRADHVSTRGASAAVTDVEQLVQLKLRWIVCSSGDLQTPYGKAVLKGVWLSYFLKKELEQLGIRAFKRALGILKLSRKTQATPFAISSGSRPPAIENVRAADPNLAFVLRAIDSDQILLEQAGWTAELMEGTKSIQGAKDMLEFLGERIRIPILGQTLTTKMSESGGSFAAEQGHAAVLRAIFKSDAKKLGSWVNDQLLGHLFAINFPTADPDDIPRWTSNTLLENDEDRTPLVSVPGQETGVGAPGVVLPRPKRALERAAAPLPPVTGEPSEVTRELGRYYSGLLSRYLGANPDPKVQPPGA